MFGGRTLDLQAASADELAIWTHYFQQVIERTQLEEHARKVALSAQPRESFQESASRLWADELLPSWDVERNAKRTLMLWWEGLPSSMRGDLWRRAIGDPLGAASQWDRLSIEAVPSDRHAARLQASRAPLAPRGRRAHTRLVSKGK